ncbi:MAG: BsaWI family type II restriction enzyme [bacterium]
MTNYTPTKEELKNFGEIKNTIYMKPSIKRINNFIDGKKDKKQALKDVFNQIYSIMIESKNEVEKILIERKNKGEIKDIRQAMKSIAGNSFANAIIYIFLQNKIIGNIKPDIFITSKKSQVKNFDKISTIRVDGETQKPDVDLIIFTKKKSGNIKKCIILSLKTSLRERAGQTYKWKLLMEIATTQNSIKDKYNISYNPEKMPLVCFATVNFYNEINNPQHRGMFKFFDKSFIAKPLNKNFISPLASLINFVNKSL